MRRLSSVVKPRYEMWLALLISVAVPWVAWVALHQRQHDFWFVLAICVVPIVSSLPWRYRCVFGPPVADEVWVNDEHLLVKHGKQSIEIPLTQVAAVQAPANGRIVTLDLCEPSALGRQVRFIAPPRSRCGGNFIVAELQRRLVAARRHCA